MTETKQDYPITDWKLYFGETPCGLCQGSGCPRCRYTGVILLDDMGYFMDETIESSVLFQVIESFYEGRSKKGLN